MGRRYSAPSTLPLPCFGYRESPLNPWYTIAGATCSNIVSSCGSSDRLCDFWPQRFGTGTADGASRLHTLRNLCGFFHARTTFLSLGNRSIRSQVDSSRTDVLGRNYHEGLSPCRHCTALGSLRPSGVSATHHHGDRFALLVWLPAPFADPHKLINWAGNA